MTPDNPPNDWDAYTHRIDDAPRLVLINLAFRETGPPDGADTAYHVDFELLAPGEDGLGTEADAAAVWQLEDGVVDGLVTYGLFFVGRARGGGRWQLTFYGPPGREHDVGAVAARVGQSQPKRQHRITGESDPEWSYYRRSLFPDEERLSWIMNRRVCDQLRQSGDDPTKARPVDHSLGFQDAAARDAFKPRAEAAGFVVTGTGEYHEDGQRYPYSIELQRMDVPEPDHIHEIVVRLGEWAAEHGGIHMGWGSPIVGQPSVWTRLRDLLTRPFGR